MIVKVIDQIDQFSLIGIWHRALSSVELTSVKNQSQKKENTAIDIYVAMKHSPSNY